MARIVIREVEYVTIERIYEVNLDIHGVTHEERILDDAKNEIRKFNGRCLNEWDLSRTSEYAIVGYIEQ